MMVAKVRRDRRLRPAWIRAIGVGAGLTAMAAGLAACGGSDDGGGSASGEGTVKLGVMYPPSLYPDILAGAKAGVAKLNDDGGIGGREVELEVCELEAYGNEAESNACARKFIDEGVVADIGSFGIVPTTYGLYEQAEVPAIGNFVSATSLGQGLHAGFTSPSSFPMNGGAEPLLISIGQLAKENDYKSFVGFQVEGASSMDAVETGYGQELAGTIGFALDAADLSSPAATAMEKNPDAITLAGPGVKLLQVAEALASLGFQGAVLANCVSVDEQILERVPNLLCTTQSQLASNPDERVQEVVKWLDEIDPGATMTEFIATPYAAALAVRDALDGVSGEVTGSDVLAGLEGLSIDNGITPPLTFGKALPKTSPEGATRIFADSVVYYENGNGELKPIGDGSFVSTISSP